MEQTTITGTLYELWPEDQVSPTFRKREFVVKIEEEYNGSVYENYIKCQALQGKCDFLNSYKVGDQVKVWYGLQGKRFEGKKEENIGKIFYITSVNAWKMEKLVAAPIASTPESGAPGPAANAEQPNIFAHTVDVPASGAGAGGNNFYNPAPENVDDLPF